jgi:hypothetical protein
MSVASTSSWRPWRRGALGWRESSFGDCTATRSTYERSGCPGSASERSPLGDDDGVLFVPATRAGELFTLAEKIRDTERRQAERMRGGESLRSQVRFDSDLARRQATPSLTFRDHLRSVGGAIEE